MSGFFQEALREVAKKEGLSIDIEAVYEDVKIARLTGWTMEYIAGLGLLHREAILQIHDAEQHLKRPRGK